MQTLDLTLFINISKSLMIAVNMKRDKMNTSYETKKYMNIIISLGTR